MSAMIDLTEQIPATLLGVVVGGIFPLVGVWLTNHASEKRLVAQFTHDRELKAIEREMALKKDVYLAAAEAISAGISVLGNFANFEMHDEAVTKPYAEKSSAIAKVHVIGSFDTIKALNNLTNELSSFYFTLFAERARLSKDKVDRDLLLKNIEYCGRQRDGALEMMKQFNIDGMKDSERWRAIQNNYEFEFNEIQKLVVQHGELSKRFSQKQLIFMKQCVEFAQKASALVPPLLLAVRKELDLPLDEKAYREAVNEGIGKQLAAVDQFVKDCEETFELSDALSRK